MSLANSEMMISYFHFLVSHIQRSSPSSIPYIMTASSPTHSLNLQPYNPPAHLHTPTSTPHVSPSSTPHSRKVFKFRGDGRKDVALLGACMKNNVWSITHGQSKAVWAKVLKDTWTAMEEDIKETHKSSEDF